MTTELTMMTTEHLVHFLQNFLETDCFPFAPLHLLKIHHYFRSRQEPLFRQKLDKMKQMDFPTILLFTSVVCDKTK